MVKILDASALMAYLEREPGFQKVKDAFIDAARREKKILMTTVNWGEVYYLLVRNYGVEEADKVADLIDTFPIQMVPVHLEYAKQAALYKAVKKLPYADGFAAALTKVEKGELLTRDRDFKLVENEMKIIWV